MSGFWREGFSYGYLITYTTDDVRYTIDSTGKRLAMRFVCRHTGVINAIGINIPAVSNNPPNEEDVRVAIYTQGSNLRPSTLVEERPLGGSTPLTTGVKFITGWTQSINEGEQYFVVVRNANPDPATYNFAVNYGVERGLAGDVVFPPHGSFASTDGGSTWSGLGTQRGNYQIVYNDGNTYDILVLTFFSTVRITNVPGVKFTTPSNIRLRVTGVVFSRVAHGNNFRFRITQGNNQYETITFPSTGGYTSLTFLPFISTVVLEPNTITRVEAVGVDGYLGWIKYSPTYFPPNFGFRGILNGVEQSENIPHTMRLILDQAQPFEVVGGGGGGGVFLPTTRVIM